MVLEAAYRQALAMATQLNDWAGQASTLDQLGVLYNDKLNRPKAAVTFYRQAAAIYVETGDLRDEGVIRNNIANTLHKLGRYPEARAEIERAIACKQEIGLAAMPWTSFAILHDIESATGNPAAARVAWGQARDAYLAYRRQGGYAQGDDGKLVDHVLGLIAQGKTAEIGPLFAQLTNDPNATDSLRQLMQAVVAILNGSRDTALADDPALDYDDAAEILFLIERLGAWGDGSRVRRTAHRQLAHQHTFGQCDARFPPPSDPALDYGETQQRMKGATDFAGKAGNPLLSKSVVVYPPLTCMAVIVGAWSIPISPLWFNPCQFAISTPTR